MKPISTIEVTPFLPTPLEGLRELAYNLRWTWNHEIVKLFARLDLDLWQLSNHNPVALLGKLSQEKLNQAALDEGFLTQLNRLYTKHQEYMQGKQTWFSQNFKAQSNDTIAYFSAEYGITEALAIYSGGLGILSGDHVKAASELGLPLVAVGLAYQEGYFKQYLTIDGWQQEKYPNNDFYNLPIIEVKQEDGTPLVISVKMKGRDVCARIWKAQIGRVMLYLLDTNVSQNIPEDRVITNALYQANLDIRIKQEIMLGIGGMKALVKLGIEPSVFHMNEGHSAFLAIERIAMLMEKHKITFTEAKLLARVGHVFTTHTAVPAGIDKFSPDLLDEYLKEYFIKLNLTKEEFLSLGRINANDMNESFSMANLAINLSGKINAVSKLHQEVSAKLFAANWPKTPINEIPITYVTNGIHTRSWISDEMAELFDMYLGSRWSEDIFDQNIWQKVADIPDEELWRVHEARRQKLVYFTRNRLKQQLEEKGAMPSELSEANEILDPQILTIGFARRVATYKRATLLFKDTKRLAQILLNKDKPVQILIAGKAHPEDVPAKELIRQIINFTHDEDLRKRIVFIEDYDMNVSRYLVQGVDMWLNTPRRFLEACGTSGMKVTFNGGLNFSILDGWWDEAYKATLGWAIGRGEVYADSNYQDLIESNALYELLEKEIVPAFYDRDKNNRPRTWLSKMKASMLTLCPTFNVNRMLKEYYKDMYLPAIKSSKVMLNDNLQKVKALALWNKSIDEHFKDIRILAANTKSKSNTRVGDEIEVDVAINLGSLKPSDIVVQIYYGLLNEIGEISDGKVITMQGKENKDKSTLFNGTFKCDQSGRHGFTVRVLPYHQNLNSSFDTKFVLWAQQNELVKL